VGATPPASSARPLCRARGRTVARSDAVDPRPPDLLSPGEGAATGLSRETRGRPPHGVSRGTALVSGCLTDSGPGVRVSRVAPIAPSSAVGGRRQAALWQPRARAALPRAVHPPRCHLQSPARRRHGRHGFVSVEGLSAREPDSHADARRRRIPPALPPARPAETLRPHPLLRPARGPVPHPRSGDESHGLGGQPATPVTAPSVASTPMRSWPCPRCGAPMRIVERLTPRQLFLAVLLADIVYDSS